MSKYPSRNVITRQRIDRRSAAMSERLDDATHEREYVGNIRQRRVRCECDYDVPSGNCPGPAHCPYSGHEERDE